MSTQQAGAAGAVKILLATHNAGKVAELKELLEPLLPGITVLSAADVNFAEPVEDAVTFEGNALIKARAAAAATGLISVADDSGLVVDVLGHAPGVFSARWSGHHGDDVANYRLLLAQLSDVPDAYRTARFFCSAVVVTPDGREATAGGEMRGKLLRQPRGTNGFGYDPIFQPEGETRSSAELTAEEKDAISHRGKAFRALAPEIVRLVAEG